MTKYNCECPTCKARIEQEFLNIVFNPVNGQWLTREEALAALPLHTRIELAKTQ